MAEQNKQVLLRLCHGVTVQQSARVKDPLLCVSSQALHISRHAMTMLHLAVEEIW